MDIKLDSLDQDVMIENGDVTLISGRDAVAQDLSQRLKMFQGEWFLDTDAGVPYYQSILQKNPDPKLVDGLLKDAILSTPGIIELLSFDLQYDGALRDMILNFSASTSDGVIDFSQSIGA